jgi:type IV pilus assembly protein PilE
MIRIYKKSSGFTLIEMLIAVAIAGILAGLAYSSYTSSVQKSNRTDAKDALLQAAARQERFYLRSNQYSNDINDVGGAASREGYYTVAVDANDATLNGPCGEGTCYVLSATANIPGGQAGDTVCAVFRLDNLGRQESDDADGNDTTDQCW